MSLRVYIVYTAWSERESICGSSSDKLRAEGKGARYPSHGGLIGSKKSDQPLCILGYKLRTLVAVWLGTIKFGEITQHHSVEFYLIGRFSRPNFDGAWLGRRALRFAYSLVTVVTVAGVFSFSIYARHIPYLRLCKVLFKVLQIKYSQC